MHERVDVRINERLLGAEVLKLCVSGIFVIPLGLSTMLKSLFSIVDQLMSR